ncbi:hypothetical protein BDU57DRAFT_180891 [Ampelomyces quisqualis]|uniref:Uncharacterized protein n=1 Tax=Ampelomyces quisqualis TaxID=50730 RepID=A0A6A5QSW5_AMPQU|nr:hypothetical protein BDU57DRAFT_180891 [Ampelomyces quisqualis]
MPRVTPYRCLRTILLPWIVMLGMWFFLPSPVIPPHQRGAYIQNKLASGNTVITALDYKPFLRHPGRVYSGECSECSDILPHWRLRASGPDLLLSMSYYYDGHSNLNLNDVLRDATQWHDRTWTGHEWKPYFSPPLGFGGVPGGDTAEEINMPWFDVTDQKLIHYNMHNFETHLNVRAVVPEPGVVEIWRNAYIEPILHDTIANDEQIVYNELNRKKEDLDLLASFQLLDKGKGTRVLVKYLAGSLPSRTYPIRRALLVPLGPFIAVPFIVLGGLLESLSSTFFYIILYFGFLAGIVCYRKMLGRGPASTPCGTMSWPFDSFFGGKCRSRNRKKGVWGPTGPVELGKNWNTFDEEKEVGLQRPKTVRLGRGWND